MSPGSTLGPELASGSALAVAGRARGKRDRRARRVVAAVEDDLAHEHAALVALGPVQLVELARAHLLDAAAAEAVVLGLLAALVEVVLALHAVGAVGQLVDGAAAGEDREEPGREQRGDAHGAPL
jgi:hypothetical protein